MSIVRVRFAPSPTGYLHVGNVRTAIFNWLFARHSNGKMILRVEDTDSVRSSQQYQKALIDDLHWLGLDWDEGLGTGGDYGPYRQSERLPIYREFAEKLLNNGSAFYCYCTDEEIKSIGQRALARGEDPHYDGHCYELTKKQVQKYQQDRRKPVIRFRVLKGEISFFDLIHDKINFDGSNISDFVLIRSDGIATYNFAAAVDDGLMEISHVIRGEDHLSNTPKQVRLLKALDFNLPAFVHIPMILADDRSKLSKRHGDNRIQQYRHKGYLPEALINFLSLLVWSSLSGEEILSLPRLVKEFDFKRVSKAAAIFDEDKLNWMNGFYLRKTDLNRIVELGIPYLKKAGFDLSDQKYVAESIQVMIERIDHLDQLPEMCRIFFQNSVDYKNAELLKTEDSVKIFQQFLAEIQNISRWNKENFFQVMKTIQKETGIKGKNLWMPVRLALTGKEHGPELPKIVELLGKKKCEMFIKNVLQI